VIDTDGYRKNVGIVLMNSQGQVLFARRVGQAAWQFPQGGVRRGEALEQALYRELYEEIGLTDKDVKLLCSTDDWLCYQIPKQYLRYRSKPLCIGQRQKWFLLELISHEKNICLTKSNKPEFEQWAWVDYWLPVEKVIDFKRNVYQRALQELKKKLSELC